jgi:hypothetical protein
MGVDIYLQSIWKPFEETFSPPEPAAPIIGVEGLIAHTTKGFDAMRASGGYFRNGYNSGDVMWAMGLTWHGTFSPMLDQAHLPIERARELIAMIEARPLNRERVAAHIFEHMDDGAEPDHPFVGRGLQWASDAAATAAGKRFEPLGPPDLDQLFQFLNTRRDELLAILRKSVELDEPLYCSL